MVIVDEEPEVAAVAFDQPPEQSFNNSGWKIEELPNEERAIVLYNPSTSITTPIVHSPSNFSVSIHPQFISGLKSNSNSSWLYLCMRVTVLINPKIAEWNSGFC